MLDILTTTISDFATWYDITRVNLGDDNQAFGRYAGVARYIGWDMCYWVVPISGIPVADSTVQHVTSDDLFNPDIKSQVKAFNSTLESWLDDGNDHIKSDLSPALDSFEAVDPAYGDGSLTPMDKEYGLSLEEEVDDADLNF